MIGRIGKMKIKNGFVLREIAGQTVVAALGSAAQSFNGMIKLNSTGKLIWELLEKERDEAQIVEAMLEEYDIDRATVERDVARVIKTLQEANILE